MNFKNSECRLLDHNDIDKLDQFIENLTSTDDKITWESIKSSVKNKQVDLIVSACIKNNIIVSCTLGYSINSVWNKNVIPYWIMGRYQSIDAIDKETLDIVQKNLTNYFENKNFFTFYTVFKLNKKLNYENCEDYMYRFIEKSFFHDTRYITTVEKILYHNFNYNNLPLFYKNMSFKNCKEHQSIVIARHDLKYKFRKDDD